MVRLALVIAAAWFAIAPAQAQDAPLQPSGKWSVAFEDTMCVLSRDYGSGDTALRWSLQPMPGDPRLEMVVSRPGTGKRRYRRGIADLRMQPSGEGVQGEFDEALIEQSNLFVSRIHVDRAAMAGLGESASLSMRLQGAPTIRIALPGIGNALKTLGQCEDDLIRRWGFDPEVLHTLKRPARRMSDADALIQRDEIPLTATNKPGLRGTVRARWTVDVNGRATDCFIVVSSGVEIMDHVTCSIVVTRMRYRPALGADGNPVATLDSNTFVWVGGDE